MNTLCRIRLFGLPRLERGNRSVSRFRPHQTGSLLGYLAYHRQREHPREVLIETIWPNREQDSGRNLLSMALSALRAALQTLDLPASRLLLSDRYTVQLNPECVTTDVAEMTSFTVLPAGIALLQRIQRLEQAVSLAQDTFLAGYYDEWIESPRRYLEQCLFDTLGSLTTDLMQAGQYAKALVYAERAAQREPLSEAACQTLLDCYTALNRPNAANRHCRQFRQLSLQEVQGTASVVVRRPPRSQATAYSSDLSSSKHASTSSQEG